MRNNAYKVILRKTCISGLPIEAMKEKGEAYVATISANPGELDIIPFERWEEICGGWLRSSATDDLQKRKYVRNAIAYAIEYRIDEGTSTLYTSAASLLGEPGDRLEMFWNGDRWTIRNANKQE